MFFTTYNYTDQVKEDEIDTACSTNGCEERCSWDNAGKAIRKETIRNTRM
jgi:hypothetical protein